MWLVCKQQAVLHRGTPGHSAQVTSLVSCLSNNVRDKLGTWNTYLTPADGQAWGTLAAGHSEELAALYAVTAL